MDPDQDAYGRAIRDFHKDGEGFELVERDDGWIGPSGGPDQYFRTYEDWPARQQAAMDHVEGRVLDIGCGAGRHALYLQERGHEVVAIDVSPNAVQVSRDRGLSDVRKLGIESVTGLEGPFDTILMLGNNFGLVGHVRLPQPVSRTSRPSPRRGRRSSPRAAIRTRPMTPPISTTTTATSTVAGSAARSVSGCATAGTPRRGSTTSSPLPTRWRPSSKAAPGGSANGSTIRRNLPNTSVCCPSIETARPHRSVSPRAG